MPIKKQYHSNGQIRYVKYTDDHEQGKLHKEEGPAIQEWYEDGQESFREYYVDGNLHRIDGPAIQEWGENGQETLREYWVNGHLHKEDGPAVEYNDGTKKWYIDGKLHRDDGPAYQSWYGNGQEILREYRIHGKLHRLDGPAFQFWYENGKEREREYWIEGEKYTEYEFYEAVNNMQESKDDAVSCRISDGSYGKFYGSVDVKGVKWAIVIIEGSDKPELYNADDVEIQVIDWVKPE